MSITVADDDGGEGTDSLLVTVHNTPPTVDLGPDRTIDEGQPIGSSSFADLGTDTWTATVDYGDGSGTHPLVINPDKSFSLSHGYEDNGVYTVRVVVTDDDGGVGTDTLLVTVHNVPPAVDLGPDRTINEGDSFSGSGSFLDPGADAWTATVDYGDGSVPAPLALKGDKTFTLGHAYPPLGSYTVKVEVVDDDGGIGSATMRVVVKNVSPAVHINAAGPINEGDTFTGGGSFADPGPDTWTATVDYGDGLGKKALALNPDKTFALSHVYVDSGVFRITVCVRDSDGGLGCGSLPLRVNNLAPVIEGGMSLAGTEGQAVLLGPLPFTDAGMADSHSALVDWGDGGRQVATVDGPKRTVSASHAYADNGAYKVTVTVTDDDGAAATATYVVKVANAAPRVRAMVVPTKLAGLPFSAPLALFEDPGKRDMHSAVIDWGDGTTSSGTVSGGTVHGRHQYAKAGTYTVIVTVIDDDGGVGKVTLTITVTTAPRRGR